MPVLQRVAKTKTRRGKRALLKREPQLVENTKTLLLTRGLKASLPTVQCMKDFAILKKPHAVYFSRKNDYHPFEDITPLESYAKKYDASLFIYGSHSKKRQHNLTLGRFYDSHILDMVELGIENFKSLDDFKGPKVSLGCKSCLLFTGEQFIDDPTFKRIQNLLADIFRGPEVVSLRLAGIEHVFLFSAVQGKIYMRSFRVLMKKSGTRVPRIELEEIGPSVDFQIRRTHFASDDLYKLASKRPVELKTKKVKNITQDKLGSTLGRIHMKKQNMGKLQTRKLKGLKKTLAEKKAEKKTNALKRKSDGLSSEREAKLKRK